MRSLPELNIVYQDTALVVVVKPGGLLAVPGRGPDKQDCVTSRLRLRFPDCIPQPAVHRLDMETSGLMVLALNARAHRSLSIQFQERQVTKQYAALIEGGLEVAEGEIRLPLRLDIYNRPYQVYDPIHGKPAVTRWRKIRISNSRTRVALYPETGRTHQLRVHMAHRLGLGCPIVGDRLYGTGRNGDRMLLHAVFLGFRHPEDGRVMGFESTPDF